jgi:siroheme synthase (precorrin-2 oxidase/ferrochelatase)
MTLPMLLPVSLNLHGKTCLVVGGGNIAEKCGRSLLAWQVLVRLVSPQSTP